MTVPASRAIKAFVPARDFDESIRFYQQLGFDLDWKSEKIAQFSVGDRSFLLQDHYVRDHADNFMMYLEVENVDDWWNYIQECGVAKDFSITLKPPRDYPWGMREIHMIDPTGVFWHFAQSIES